jgi:hypothetical protein
LSSGPLSFERGAAGLELRVINGRGEEVPTLRHEVYATWPGGPAIPDNNMLLAAGAAYQFDPIAVDRLGIVMNQPGKFGLTVVIDGRGFSSSSNLVWITITN